MFDGGEEGGVLGSVDACVIWCWSLLVVLCPYVICVDVVTHNPMVPGLPVLLGMARVVVRGHRVSSEHPGHCPGHLPWC